MIVVTIIPGKVEFSCSFACNSENRPGRCRIIFNRFAKLVGWHVITGIVVSFSRAHKQPSKPSGTSGNDVPRIESIENSFPAHKATRVS